MGKILGILTNSFVGKLILTLIVYGFYACMIGLSLVPSITIIVLGVQNLILTLNSNLLHSIKNISLFGFMLGAAVYSYFIFGLIVMGIFYRVLSLGVKDGVYSISHPVFYRWLVYSGINNIVMHTIMPIMVMTSFSTMYYRIIGCKIGKNCYINTPFLNDAYLMEFGDNVIIGGTTELTAHIFGNNKLVLKKIKIGDNSLIGGHCYLMPGVEIGKNCVIGISTTLRKDTKVADHTKLGSLAGLPLRKILKVEQDK